MRQYGSTRSIETGGYEDGITVLTVSSFARAQVARVAAFHYGLALVHNRMSVLLPAVQARSRMVSTRRLGWHSHSLLTGKTAVLEYLIHLLVLRSTNRTGMLNTRCHAFPKCDYATLTDAESTFG